MKTKFGTLIRERRKALGKSQAMIAAEAGVGQIIIARLETGGVFEPSSWLFARLLDVLQIPAEEGVAALSRERRGKRPKED